MKRKQTIICFLISLIILLLTSITSSAQSDQNILSVETYCSAKQVPAGNQFKIALIISIKPGYHINANEPLDPIYIPTRINFESVEGLSFGKVFFPEPEIKRFGFSEDELAIFENTITIYSTVTVNEDFRPGPVTINGTVHYQACTDQNCFLPQDEPSRISVDIVDENQHMSLIHQNIFDNFPSDAIQGTEEKEVSEASQLTTDELRAKQVIEKGLIYAIAAFFVFGLALNLTPCVYPVIPITVSYFGGQASQQRGKAFIKALTYVIGIAIVFSLLGLISGLAGKQWGFLFQNPWFVLIVTVIILAMAASMFGAFEITVPAPLMNKLGQAREGIIGSFIMGLTVGVVIAPCAAGIIIGLVGLVAKLGIVTKGTILFFIMGLGLGIPYLILATFSSLLNRLPQSGMWMVWVKKLFGILLIGVALYFFLPQAKHIPNMQGFFFGLLIIFGGLLLGFLDHAPGYTKQFKIGRAVFGILVILFGVHVANRAIHYQAPQTNIAWHHYTDESIDELTQQGKPVFIDFYADWCAPCKEMDQETFSNPQVIELAKKFTMVKVDCTVPNEDIRAFMDQFQVTGMPTLAFLNQHGEELTSLREVGFVGPEDFVQKMKKALQNHIK